MKIQDPTVAFSHVVTARRRGRAALTAERFRLGIHGLECGSASPPSDRAAVVGASAWALKAEQVEDTVELIGVVGGLLADLGFQVCPIGADVRPPRPSIVWWICVDETESDEYLKLVAMGVPGLSLGSCVDCLDDWSFISTDELEDRSEFIRLFVAEVEALLDATRS